MTIALAQNLISKEAPPDVRELLQTDQPLALAGGRTNRLWTNGQTVAKIYSSDAQTPLFANDPEAEWQALTSLSGSGLAPEPISRHRSDLGECLLYQHVEGRPGAADPEAVAALLYRLHSLPAQPNWAHAAMGEDVSIQSEAMASGLAATLRLTPPPPPQPTKPVPIHRDPIPMNIVATATTPVLIDWQCPGLGDPLEDIAHYLSPAMHQLYGTGPQDRKTRDSFLGAYPDTETVSRYRAEGAAFHWRMAAYCAWQVRRGNADYRLAFEAEVAFLRAGSGAGVFEA